MFYWLTDFSDKLSFLNVFRYITFRTGGAIVTALVFVFLFGGPIIDMLRVKQGKGQPIRTDGPQSHLITKKGTPTMGGLMILSGLLVSTLLWANPTNPYVWIVLGVTLSFGMIGFYDDYLKVTRQTNAGFAGRTRFVAEWAIAVVACTALAHLGKGPIATSLVFPFFKELVINLGWAFVLLGGFVIVGAGNAVNLTDGLDGLAIVPVMIAAASFGLISYLAGNADVREISADPLCRRHRRIGGAVRRGDRRRLWASSGSTRRRPRSSWAIPVRSRSAACSAPSRSPSSTRSCSPSSAGCSCWRRCR